MRVIDAHIYKHNSRYFTNFSIAKYVLLHLQNENKSFLKFSDVINYVIIQIAIIKLLLFFSSLSNPVHH